MIENQNSSREQGMEKFFFRASAEDFEKIPGSPIAYWASEKTFDLFSDNVPLRKFLNPKQGTSTGNDEIYVRHWFELNIHEIGFNLKNLSDSLKSEFKYFPLDKGGGFRRWYGNNEKVIKFGGGAYEELLEIGNHLPSREQYFKRGLTWSKITSSKISVRYDDYGFAFSSVGLKGFPDENEIYPILGYMNSLLVERFTEILSPTLSIISGDIEKLPYEKEIPEKNSLIVSVMKLVSLSKEDWDSFETSWDFTSLQLLQSHFRQQTLKACYQTLRAHWHEITLEMQHLEEENNRIFIDTYGLRDELMPEVPLNEITLTCNPHYRYGGDKSEEELEALLLADTMRELVSYAVGCMLGRYSLDKPGLILANQGETLTDYLAQVPEPSFPADDDNVIPVLDGDWFADDITLRFRQFLRVAFGDEHYDENLAFIEQALNVKGKRNYSLRDYFLSEFYADHVKRYKKRPIYWLFSSPKGSFNALIYMHRYRPDTVSVVLKYLRDYREKLSTEKERQASVSINPATSQGDKTRALKEVDRLAKVLAELEDYERDVLYPLATEQKPIDLDDGVKVNYLKFGAALKKITGLDAKEED